MMANDLGYLFTEINISKMYNMSTCPHTQKRLGIGRKRVTWCVLTMIRDYKVYQQNTESNKSIKTRKREREPNRDDQTKIAGIPFGTMANTSHLLSLAKLTTRNHSISFISSVSANRHTHTHPHKLAHIFSPSSITISQSQNTIQNYDGHPLMNLESLLCVLYLGYLFFRQWHLQWNAVHLFRISSLTCMSIVQLEILSNWMSHSYSVGCASQKLKRLRRFDDFPFCWSLKCRFLKKCASLLVVSIIAMHFEVNFIGKKSSIYVSIQPIIDTLTPYFHCASSLVSSCFPWSFSLVNFCVFLPLHYRTTK